MHRDSVEQLCGAHNDTRQIVMWLDGRTPGVYQAAIDRGQFGWPKASDIIGFVEVDGYELSKAFIAGDRSGQGVDTRLLDVALDTIAGFQIAAALGQSVMSSYRITNRLFARLHCTR